MAMGRVLIGSFGLLVCRGYAHSHSNLWSFSVMVGSSKCLNNAMINCASVQHKLSKKKKKRK